tara:strand:- start:1378 stop:1875 length:498 start_codon:yes stop_codon:yes gene_type:complete
LIVFQPKTSDLEREATKFRTLIELCDKFDTPLVLQEFPVMSCKLTSLLLTYHFLRLWPEIEIFGACGFAKQRRTVSHYWLEVGNIAIDITGDQYNLIPSKELCRSITKNRPFSPIHISPIDSSYLYHLFDVRNRDRYKFGLEEIAEDFKWRMEISYEKITSKSLA